MSETPRGDSPQSGRSVEHGDRPDPAEDDTAVSPAPMSAADDEATTRTSAPGRPAPARDELARTPVPYTPAQLPAPPPGQPYPQDQPYPQPGYPPAHAPAGYPTPNPMPVTGYVPTHAYDPPAGYSPAPYAPAPYAPAAEPPPFTPPASEAPPSIIPPTVPRMDGVATAAIICSILGIPLIVVACTGVPFCITGIIMGFVARHRIAVAGGKLSGEGTALAAIIVGAIGIAFFVLLLASFLVTPTRSGL
jgi:hypothetical protein